MTTKLFLIRHGQTDCNLEKRYSGFLDVDLNAAGRKQAKLLQKRLNNLRIDNIYSSDRLRAINSAGIIFDGLNIEQAPELRELHFGIFEGLTYKQITRKYPRLYKNWLADPFNVSIPQAENLYDFQKRIITAFNAIIADNIGKVTAIVCHGGVISMFINSILKSSARIGLSRSSCREACGMDFWNYIPDSASLSIIAYKNNKADIKLFNDTTHLPPRRDAAKL